MIPLNRLSTLDRMHGTAITTITIRIGTADSDENEVTCSHVTVLSSDVSSTTSAGMARSDSSFDTFNLEDVNVENDFFKCVNPRSVNHMFKVCVRWYDLQCRCRNTARRRDDVNGFVKRCRFSF